MTALLITALYSVVDQLFIGNSGIGSIGNTATTALFPLTIFALALSLLIGDGAHHYKRCLKTYSLVMASSLVVTSLATVLFEAWPTAIISLFGNASGTYVDFGVKCFRIYLSFLILTGLKRTSSVLFQALGKPIQATILSLVRDLVLLVPLSIILPLGLGIDGFLLSAPLADVISFVLTATLVIIEYRSLLKKERDVSLLSLEPAGAPRI